MSTQPTNVQLSLSIEETNKIRISMGLKPLKVEEPKESKPKQQQDKPINEETLNVLDTINKLKKKRELNSKLIGKSIAEQLLDQDENEDDFDVSNWVNKSRQTEKQKQIEKKKSLTTTGKKQQQHYNQSNLQGMRVGNDIKNFEDESEHILTLQDSSVLDEDSEDVLVNVNISEREKREKLIQSNKKKSKYETEEDAENSDTTINVDRNGFIIGGDGKIDQSTTDSNGGNGNGLSLREQAKKNLEHLQSYDMEQNTTSSILSSFYTQEEMDKFKKSRESSSSSGSNGKKKKKLRKKSTTENILNELDATTSSDLGSRASRSISEKEKKEQQSILTREENYKKALDKASEIAKLTYSSDLYEEAEDEEFYKSLSTAKKAPVLQEKSIAEKMKKKQKEIATNVDMDDDGTTNLDEITINPTSEFVRSLNPDGLISNYRSSNTGRNNDDDNNNNGNSEQQQDEEMINIEKQESGNDEEDGDDGDSSSGEDEDGNYNQGKTKKFKNEVSSTSILLEEPLASSGVSAALRLLAQKGDLQPNPVSSGKKKNINYDNSESTIIEHKDEFGRIMNRQQAFVKMSQIFHGNKSGKNKMEKRKRLYEEELKKMKMDSNDTPLGMVKSFQAFQEKTNSPYLVLSGGSTANVLKQNSLIQQANINNNNKK